MPRLIWAMVAEENDELLTIHTVKLALNRTLKICIKSAADRYCSFSSLAGYADNCSLTCQPQQHYSTNW